MKHVHLIWSSSGSLASINITVNKQEINQLCKAWAFVSSLPLAALRQDTLSAPQTSGFGRLTLKVQSLSCQGAYLAQLPYPSILFYLVYIVAAVGALRSAEKRLAVTDAGITVFKTSN